MAQIANGSKDTNGFPLCELDEYLNLFKAEFQLIDGCVLAYIPRIRQPRTKAPGNDAIFRARHENQQNHQHFQFSVGSTAYERWQNNLILAQGVQAFWSCKLSQQFPGREFAFVIWNELAVMVDEDNRWLYAEVVPALRMWSVENDPDGTTHKAFSAGRSKLNEICLNVDCLPVFLSVNEVFTRKGSIRKTILSRGSGGAREMLTF